MLTDGSKNETNSQTVDLNTNIKYTVHKNLTVLSPDKDCYDIFRVNEPRQKDSLSQVNKDQQ